MKFEIYKNNDLIGYIEFNENYRIEIREDFYWLYNFFEIMLNEPIFYKDKILEPFSNEHLLACIEHFEIIKNSKLDWNNFIRIVGGDIRDIYIYPSKQK